MQQPHYIFLGDNGFALAITDKESEEVTLIHPFQTEQQTLLQGGFAQSLFQQLFHREDVDTSGVAQLSIIEKQHAWLIGLSQASLVPSSMQHTVVGDELGLLFLEITDQCNERCIHCYASSSPECHDFLSLEEIKSVLMQARSLGRPFVQFTGGDPLIHRNLVEAVAFASSLDIQGIEIYTNGLLLHEPLLEALLPYQPNIAFSLYSPDADVHDGITQVPGSFKRTIAAMHRAQDMAFKIRIGMAVMEQNAGQEPLMLDFAKSEFFLDATSVRFDPVHETGRGESLNTKHITLMPSKGSHVPSEEGHHVVVQTDQPKKWEVGKMPSASKRRGKLAVCANGQVSPCIFNRSHQLGSIREKSLLEILGANNACRGNLSPSITRWNQCQHNLSCADCQMVAYTLGDNT